MNEWAMDSSMTAASTVAPMVNSEHDHGLLARLGRQPRMVGILSSVGTSGAKGILGGLCRGPAAVFQPLEAERVGDGILSQLRRSNVPEPVISDLAEVKLLLFPSCLCSQGGFSAETVSVGSSSSEEDLLRIEMDDELHPERGGGMKGSSKGGRFS